MSDVIEQVAKFLWECDQQGTTDEWREMAWNDMGGSEPTDERQIYEIRARSLADAGLLARPLPTRDEIEQAVHDSADFLYWETCLEIADAVLDLMKGQDA